MKEYAYSTHTKEGKFLKVPVMKDCVDAILTRHEQDLNRIAYLENEIAKLKSETYKDDELQKAKEKVKVMEEDYYRGFPISKEEEAKINEWKENHDKEKHGLITTEDKLRAGGCIGGRYTYKFVPTSIGTIGYVVCDKCGEEFTFNELF